MARVCDVHGIAASPEGACALCVREASRARSQRVLFVLAAATFFALAAISAVAVARDALRAKPNAALAGEEVPGTAPPASAATTAATVAPPSPIVPASPPAANPTSTAARSKVAITIYSASWCGFCRKAKSFMDKQGLTYVERDVDDDDAAKAELRKISPKGSIPALRLDQETMVGWNEEVFLEKLDRAASRRL